MHIFETRNLNRCIIRLVEGRVASWPALSPDLTPLDFLWVYFGIFILGKTSKNANNCQYM
jgi:hypothetical protein